MQKIVSRGSRGELVKSIQAALGISQDGVFGSDTERALRDFQARSGLAVDGVAGDRTLAALLGAGKAITEQKIRDAAGQLRIDEASMRAVLAVESSGAGFLVDGRPKILFERHIMHRLLGAAGRDADLLALYMPDVVNASPGGYKGGAAEHNRLHLARQVDFDIATCSASWGLFQIMGFHWQALGYDSPADFASRMSESEDEQLEAFVRFMQSNPSTHKALIDRDWHAFARRYNGPGYAKNDYAGRLEAAHREFA